MKIITLKDTFSVCKTVDLSAIDLNKEYFFIGKTATENSLICPTHEVPKNVMAREDNWRGFFIDGTLDFSLIGILADISTILARKKIGIVAVSTYDTDYVFVKENNFSSALAALEESGYSVEDRNIF